MSNETIVKEPSGATVEVKAWCPAAHVENDSWLWWKTWIFCAFHTQVVLVNSSVCPSNTTFSLVDIVTEWIQESEEVTEPSRLFESVTTSRFFILFFFHFVHFTCTLSSLRTHTHVNTYELPGFHAYLDVTSYTCVKTRGVKSQITSNSFLPEGIITGAFPAERMFTCSISAKYLRFVPSSISLLNDYVETRAVLGEVYKWCLCSLAVWNPMLYSAATKSKHSKHAVMRK